MCWELSQAPRCLKENTYLFEFRLEIQDNQGMDKQKILLAVWLVGILFPLNWLERIVSNLRQVYWMLTGSEPVHVIGHLILFSGLVILILQVFQLPLNKRSAIWLVLLVLALGLGQEYFQLQVKGRLFGWPEVFDLSVDLTAGAVGWAAYQYYLRNARYLRMIYFMLLFKK